MDSRETIIHTNGNGNCFYYFLTAVGVLARSLIGEDRFAKIFGTFFTNGDFDLMGFRKLLRNILVARARGFDLNVFPVDKRELFHVLLHSEETNAEFEKMEKNGDSIDSNFAEMTLYILAKELRLRFNLYTEYDSTLIESPGHGTQSDQEKIPLVKIYLKKSHFTGAMDLTEAHVSAETLKLLQKPFDAEGKVTGRFAGADGGELYLKYLNDLRLSQEQDEIQFSTVKIFDKKFAMAQYEGRNLEAKLQPFAPSGYEVRVTVEFVKK